MERPVWSGERAERQLHIPWFLDPDADQVDVGLMFWNLEKRIESNPEKWWPGNKKCYCGEEAASFTRRAGYRCKDHLQVPVGDQVPTERLPIGYSGDLDGSGDYEHDWTSVVSR